MDYFAAVAYRERCQGRDLHPHGPLRGFHRLPKPARLLFRHPGTIWPTGNGPGWPAVISDWLLVALVVGCERTFYAGLGS